MATSSSLDPSPRGRYRLKTLRAKLLMAGLSVALVIGCLEGAARFYVWKKYGEAGWGMNWRFHYEPYVLTRTDDRCHAAIPPKGAAYRVLVIGGSTASLIPNATLEAHLAPVVGRPVEVINMGQGAYILNQERITLLLHGLPVEPDMILTVDGANDLVTATKTLRPGIAYANDFVALGVEHPIRNGVFGLIRDSQFINCVNKLRERSVEREAHGDLVLIESTVTHMRESLRSISTIAKGLGVPHALVVQPYLHLRRETPSLEKTMAAGSAYRSEFTSNGFRALLRTLSEHRSEFGAGVFMVDATTAFDQSPDQCFIDEVHLTDLGNDLLCARLAAELTRAEFHPAPPQVASQ